LTLGLWGLTAVAAALLGAAVGNAYGLTLIARRAAQRRARLVRELSWGNPSRLPIVVDGTAKQLLGDVTPDEGALSDVGRALVRLVFQCSVAGTRLDLSGHPHPGSVLRQLVEVVPIATVYDVESRRLEQPGEVELTRLVRLEGQGRELTFLCEVACNHGDPTTVIGLGLKAAEHGQHMHP
jgi:hypothetical protein